MNCLAGILFSVLVECSVDDFQVHCISDVRPHIILLRFCLDDLSIVVSVVFKSSTISALG